MDRKARNALERLFDEVNQHVGSINDPDSAHPNEAIAAFSNDGGNLTTLSDDTFEVKHMRSEDLRSWNSPWKASYGLDGSSTTPLVFQNGLTATASAAKLGVAGHTDNDSVRHNTTISSIVYYDNPDFELEKTTFESDEVSAELAQFPSNSGRPYRLSKITNWLLTLANSHAEGKHAYTHADQLDGPLFIDGPLYPSEIFSWMLFAQGNQATEPLTLWPEMIHKILDYYIKTIETLHDKGLPVVGVTKTTKSTIALEALVEKSPHEESHTTFPWNSDYQLFSAALFNSPTRPTTERAISYTPWLLIEKYGSGSNQVKPFDYNGVELKYGLPDDYQKAFFYARTPSEDRVMRIEAPYCTVDTKEKREEVQKLALKELDAQQKEPRAITAADELARIPKSTRNELRRILVQGIETESIIDYNERRGYDEFEDNI